MRSSILVAALASCAAALYIDKSDNDTQLSSDVSVKHSGFSATPAHLIANVSHFDCGTNISHASDHFLATVHHLHVSGDLFHPHSPTNLARRARRAPSNINVNLYFHIVTKSSSAGTITPAMISKQLTQLQLDYRPHGIIFTLRNTSFTANDAWAIGATTADDAAMKSALRQGTYSALNIYFQTDLSGGVLGRCTLPTNVGSNPDRSIYVVDGCNIAAETMPGGSIYGYNMGKTAVHETGHWLGLLHTFEGYSCQGSGDYIADTPQESQSTNGCPTSPWKNSCAKARVGVDPIHNFMDYSTDACYTRFTSGQEGRIRSLWPMYRQGK